MIDRGSDQSATLSFEPPRRELEEPGDDAGKLIERLGIASGPRPVLVVCGGAGDLENGDLQDAHEVVGPAVTQAAATCGATVVTGGTDAGIMKVVGGARRRNQRAMPLLVGVAPRGKVEPDGSTELEPNHTHAVLADSAEWGGETPLLFDVADALSARSPAVVLLANGGEHSRAEAREAAHRGWPLVVFDGLGGIADDIAAISRLPEDARGGTDRELRRLAEYDRLAVCRDATELAEILAWELTDHPALIQAWRIFTAYDEQAGALQKKFRALEAAILLLGVLATILALVHGIASGWAQETLHFVLVALPTLLTAVIAWGGRRAFGKRWVLLRAAAEAVKAETFRYRTATPPYAVGGDRGATLADRLAVINRQLDGTEAVTGALPRPARVGPPAGRGFEDLARLDPVAYLQHRVIDQVAYYHRRAGQKAKTRDGFLVATLGFGAVGTVLAAVGVEPAVAFTTAVAAGTASYVGSLQYDRDVVVYNQSAAELEATHLEWAGRRNAPDAVDRLVDRTETILTEEVGDWARRMARAMDDQTRRQP